MPTQGIFPCGGSYKLLVSLMIGIAIASTYVLYNQAYSMTDNSVVVNIHQSNLFSTSKLKLSDTNNQESTICTQTERIQRLRKKCRNLYTNPGDWSTLTAAQKDYLSRNVYVDMQHKILGCLPPKSGCTTWKSIFANNTHPEPLPDDYPTWKLHYGGLTDYNITRLHEFNQTMQEYIITSNDYHKFMIARHPFNRIYSGYTDKFVSDTDPPFRSIHGGKILQMFHPERQADNIQQGKGVSFQDFVNYLKLPLGSDHHWDPIESICLPCSIHYDRVLKTESLNVDNAAVITERLGPYHRGVNTRLNDQGSGGKDKGKDKEGRNNTDAIDNKKHFPSIFSPQGRQIKEYRNLSEEDIEYLIVKYRKDLALFGYSWQFGKEAKKEDKGVMYTQCRHGALGDHVCC